jgi:virginiamycin B lyase
MARPWRQLIVVCGLIALLVFGLKPRIEAGAGATKAYTMDRVSGQRVQSVADSHLGRLYSKGVPGSITEFSLPTQDCNPNVGCGAANITAGPDGALWFTEKFSSQVGRITTSGKISHILLPAGSDLKFGIARGPGGTVWLTGPSGIGRVSPGGSLKVFSFPQASDAPAAITAGPDGNMWFIVGIFSEGPVDTDKFGNKIGRITPQGRVTIFHLPKPNGFPSAIAAGPDGNLWFTAPRTNKIGRITPTGKVTEFSLPTSNSEPTSIVVGPDGNLWFTEASGIGRITKQGSITEFPVTDVASSSLVAGSADRLWFLEGTGIGTITPEGSVADFPLPAHIGSITSLAIGPDGNLWFTEYSDKIGRLVPPTLSSGPTIGNFYTSTKAAYDIWSRQVNDSPPVRVASFPMSTPYVAYYFDYQGAKPGLTHFKVLMRDHTGAVFSSGPSHVLDHQTGSFMTYFYNLPFYPSGSYRLDLLVNGNSIRTVPFTVT